ncbi:MAG: DUF3450 domain-containing protein [Methylococcales bacterium]|nr:DUF3450 domain-containing protein [Methylococcales bacterium]
MSFFYPPVKTPIVLMVAVLSFPCVSAPLEDAIRVNQATQEAAADSQKKIDTLSQQTGTLLEQYRFATRQTKNLKIQSEHLQQVLINQKLEKSSLEEQLKTIVTTQNEITPLILRMLTNLDAFIALDLPFLPEERKQRLTKLKAMMLRADVTKAEKFRRIIEAYQIENEYGNTIEAYKDEINLNGTKSPVDFLRLGRIALYYQRLDGSETGFWNKTEKRWETLPDSYRNKIHDGLSVARKQSAPDLLILPVAAAEEGK